jgi:hypothetical protein
MKQAWLVVSILLCHSAFAQDTLRVSSDQTVGGFVFPESCGYDPKGKALYVGNFGGAKLDPAAKDGLGCISKVGLNGKVLEEKFLPAAFERRQHDGGGAGPAAEPAAVHPPASLGG